MSLRSRVADAQDAFRAQLWPIPTIGILLALIAGVLLPELDGAVGEHLPVSISSYLFGGGASAARTVLDAIASSLITVTSLTFSLTVVTLQLASGQFSPGCCAPSPGTGSCTSPWPCSCPPSSTR